MTYTHEVSDNVLFINMEGDLLGLSDEQKILDFTKEFTDKEINRCAVDISQIGYMNSTGLSLLIRLLTRFRNNGGDLVLVNPSEQVKKLLVITKLNAIFTISVNREEAVRTLNK
jgi:anti-sigma B factor antagonist